MSANGPKIIILDPLKDALWLTFMNDYVYTRHPFLTYFAKCERTGLPNPACPHHVFDKILWRKVFDRDPSSVAMSDKLVSKKIACDLCPGIKVPKTLWVGEHFEDIPLELIAGDAVVKTTHGSGFFQVIRNGIYDRREMVTRTRKWMNTDYNRYHGEWAYRDIE